MALFFCCILMLQAWAEQQIIPPRINHKEIHQYNVESPYLYNWCYNSMWNTCNWPVKLWLTGRYRHRRPSQHCTSGKRLSAGYRSCSSWSQINQPLKHKQEKTNIWVPRCLCKVNNDLHSSGGLFFVKAFLHLKTESKDIISNEPKQTHNIKVYSHRPTRPFEPGECSSHTPEPEGTWLLPVKSDTAGR